MGDDGRRWATMGDDGRRWAMMGDGGQRFASHPQQVDGPPGQRRAGRIPEPVGPHGCQGMRRASRTTHRAAPSPLQERGADVGVQHCLCAAFRAALPQSGIAASACTLRTSTRAGLEHYSSTARGWRAGRNYAESLPLPAGRRATARGRRLGGRLVDACWMLAGGRGKRMVKGGQGALGHDAGCQRRGCEACELAAAGCSVRLFDCDAPGPSGLVLGRVRSRTVDSVPSPARRQPDVLGGRDQPPARHEAGEPFVAVAAGRSWPRCARLRLGRCLCLCLWCVWPRPGQLDAPFLTTARSDRVPAPAPALASTSSIREAVATQPARAAKGAVGPGWQPS
ncbi:hypothetical protein P154DRAFT_573726 [Amniculicola lignicola CBS 123094]|uniref:Uncharacterized protein n=1 Tax=Amniculicola lignicola CBS 123094 TaxID=1392246 RepID=A0A6A5WPE4_9PLEO|nr:hypothetical protein P154DRAFT_573726 [Amniculicola lignicola CBS 123094]